MSPFCNSELPNIIVIGAGGVGVITALSLCYRKKSQVSLAIRSDYEHVKEHGYTIDSCDYGKLEEWRPHYIYKTVEDASKSGKFFDYIVVTTKNIPDGPLNSRVPEVIRPLVESNRTLAPAMQTNILLVQNGLDIEKDIMETFDEDDYDFVILSGVQLIGSTKVGKGVISQVGKDHLYVGAFDSDNQNAVAAARNFVELYNNEGRNIVSFDPRVRYSRWKKLLYNAVINTTTALVGLDVPRCLEFGTSKMGTEEHIFAPAMREVINIAASEGIVLEEDIVKFFIDITRDIMFKPSMCIDCEKGQLMELEVILGNPLRVAKRNGVETPVLSMLYNLLVLVQGKLKEKNGLLKFDETKARLTE